ncbi:MAG: PIN domain-containing protein [Desulfuromonadales bacterium]|nr:PIN domain-containing protein [Desulfuromonadales bacterium]
MRVALDTNILAYAEGVGDRQRCRRALDLIARLPVDGVLLPAQTLGELYRVLTAKAGREASLVREALFGWADSFIVADSTWSAFQAAFDLSVDHRLQIWDALIMAVAAEHQCRLLLSEDLHAGFTWRGVTVVDPFQSPWPPLLNAITQTNETG